MIDTAAGESFPVAALKEEAPESSATATLVRSKIEITAQERLILSFSFFFVKL